MLKRISVATVALAVVLLICSCDYGAAGGADSAGHSAATGHSPPITTRELNLAWGTKVFCSTVFVSKLSPEAAMEHSVYPIISIFPEPFEPGDISKAEVDWERQRVRLEVEGLSRTAGFYGDQGCVLHPRDHDGIHFEPVEVRTTLGPADDEPWPLGDQGTSKPINDDLLADAVARAVDAAFHADSHTAAFIVVHDGKIVGERYGAGADRDTLLVSWSMGKSLTAALLGVLFEQGEFNDIDAVVPIAEWKSSSDPRASIRFADLLRMSSGLEFSHLEDPRETWERGHPDHMYVYSGAINVFDFVISRPLQHPPNTVGRYRNTDPLTLGAIIRRTVEARDQNYHQFPQSDLFDRIGIRKLVLEPDPYGNFVMTGFEYGRARDWARLGLLHLWDGVWMDQRILPKGWVSFVSSPAPAWNEPRYGGQFWLNRTGTWSLPENAFYMAGGGGQYTIIVPSLNLVVVRMGHFQGGLTPVGGGPSPAARHLDTALSILWAAFGSGQDSH